MSVTLIDIAQAAGVSRSTVSRALSEHPGNVRAETLEHIRRVAESLGYEPNLVARSLRSQKTNVVGIILKDLQSDATLRMIQSLQEHLNEAKYQSLLCLTKDDPKIEAEYLRTLHAQRVAGVVTSSTGQNAELYRRLLDAGVPTASVIRRAPLPGIQEFFSDEYQSALHATSYLLNLGHRRVAIVLGDQKTRSSEYRYLGYCAAHDQARVPMNPELVFRGAFGPETGQAAVAGFLGLRERPTALLIANNEAAFGVIAACVQHQIRIPDDLSLISYENSILLENWSPRISTIDTKPEMIGEQVARCLIARIESEDTPTTMADDEAEQRQFFEATLVHRDSCRTIPRST